MPANGHRRGNLVYHWKHGWIPLDHYAALQKAHGSKTGAAKVEKQHGISGHPSGSSKSHASAPNPVGKDHRSMTPAEKVRAVEVMHGTGSKQHIAAIQKFTPKGAPATAKKAAAAKKPAKSVSPTGSAMRDARLKYGAGSHEHLAAIAADRLASKKK